MTTLTVNIPNDKDLAVLQEILNRFELSYIVNGDSGHIFSESDIKGLLKTQQDLMTEKQLPVIGRI